MQSGQKDYDMGSDMQVTRVRLFDGAVENELLKGYFALRKQVFVDQMGWELFSDRALEFEQYDTAHAVYLIAHEGQTVLGGARLLPTDVVQPASYGARPYTYMIRDAFDGVLPQLPPEICSEAPPTVGGEWELTRFVSDQTPGVGRAILDATNSFLKDEGAQACLFLGPPAFMRMARSQGYRPVAMGAIQKNEDGRFLAFRCEVV